MHVPKMTRQRLLDALKAPRRIYRHRWQVGDPLLHVDRGLTGILGRFEGGEQLEGQARGALDLDVLAEAAALGDNRLVITYAYRSGARRKTYEQLCLEGKEISRAHDASWEATPIVVQKTFTARDLPARFDIDVATPKGLQPVYPRMVLLRREILAAAPTTR